MWGRKRKKERRGGKKNHYFKFDSIRHEFLRQSQNSNNSDLQTALKLSIFNNSMLHDTQHYWGHCSPLWKNKHPTRDVSGTSELSPKQLVCFYLIDTEEGIVDYVSFFQKTQNQISKCTSISLWYKRLAWLFYFSCLYFSHLMLLPYLLLCCTICIFVRHLKSF